MVLEMDNMGAVHLANNWRVGGRTQHADLKHHFSRDLKDNGIIAIWHVSGEENDLDIVTKNTIGPIFEEHIPRYVEDWKSECGWWACLQNLVKIVIQTH